MLFDTRFLGLRAEKPRRPSPSACLLVPCGPTRVEWVYAPALAALRPMRLGPRHGVHDRRRPLAPAATGSTPACLVVTRPGSGGVTFRTRVATDCPQHVTVYLRPGAQPPLAARPYIRARSGHRPWLFCSFGPTAR
eukprot:1817140-Prymnesium_polylepis.1